MQQTIGIRLSKVTRSSLMMIAAVSPRDHYQVFRTLLIGLLWTILIHPQALSQVPQDAPAREYIYLNSAKPYDPPHDKISLTGPLPQGLTKQTLQDFVTYFDGEYSDPANMTDDSFAPKLAHFAKFRATGAAAEVIRQFNPIDPQRRYERLKWLQDNDLTLFPIFKNMIAAITDPASPIQVTHLDPDALKRLQYVTAEEDLIRLGTHYKDPTNTMVTTTKELIEKYDELQRLGLIGKNGKPSLLDLRSPEVDHRRMAEEIYRELGIKLPSQDDKYAPAPPQVDEAIRKRGSEILATRIGLAMRDKNLTASDVQILTGEHELNMISLSETPARTWNELMAYISQPGREDLVAAFNKNYCFQKSRFEAALNDIRNQKPNAVITDKTKIETKRKRLLEVHSELSKWHLKQRTTSTQSSADQDKTEEIRIRELKKERIDLMNATAEAQEFEKNRNMLLAAEKYISSEQLSCDAVDMITPPTDQPIAELITKLNEPIITPTASEPIAATTPPPPGPAAFQMDYVKLQGQTHLVMMAFEGKCVSQNDSVANVSVPFQLESQLRDWLTAQSQNPPSAADTSNDPDHLPIAVLGERECFVQSILCPGAMGAPIEIKTLIEQANKNSSQPPIRFPKPHEAYIVQTQPAGPWSNADASPLWQPTRSNSGIILPSGIDILTCGSAESAAATPAPLASSVTPATQ